MQRSSINSVAGFIKRQTQAKSVRTGTMHVAAGIITAALLFNVVHVIGQSSAEPATTIGKLDLVRDTTSTNNIELFETAAIPKPESAIDAFVLRRLAQLGIEPARICSDAVFIRRVYLDVIGTLPTATEVKEFLLDKNPNKRTVLIDRLLSRAEFAEYWAMKWSDLLRVKAEFPINLWPNAAQAYYNWIRDSIRQNKPYDKFVRELLTSSGSNFRVPAVNFYRAMQNRSPEGIAQAVALSFMGVRADKWPQQKLAGMAAFFSQVRYKSTAEWKEEIVYWDSTGANYQHNGVITEQASESHVGCIVGVFPDGTQVTLDGTVDPREVFADWLIQPQNPWFTRAIVNRIWAWLLGHGIIHEPDDIRPDNPPSNPELLVYLEHELIAANYDLKAIYRQILNSKIYQLSCIPHTTRPEGAVNFAYYPVRRLEAEVLIDAINQITGTSEKYVSQIPEPFTVIPEQMRSIALPDGSITSSFLELFGRPPRDTGLESERNNRITGAQRLHLLNSTHILRKIDQSRLIQTSFRSNKPVREIVPELYLTVLSRFPTQKELQLIEAYAQSGVTTQQAVTDLMWALINSAEFIYRH